MAEIQKNKSPADHTAPRKAGEGEEVVVEEVVLLHFINRAGRPLVVVPIYLLKGRRRAGVIKYMCL